MLYIYNQGSTLFNPTTEEEIKTWMWGTQEEPGINMFKGSELELQAHLKTLPE